MEANHSFAKCGSWNSSHLPDLPTVPVGCHVRSSWVEVGSLLRKMYSNACLASRSHAPWQLSMCLGEEGEKKQRFLVRTLLQEESIKGVWEGTTRKQFKLQRFWIFGKITLCYFSEVFCDRALRSLPSYGPREKLMPFRLFLVFLLRQDRRHYGPGSPANTQIHCH